MQILDITRTLEPGMPTWPGEPGPELTPIKQMSAGDAADVSRLSLGVHTGRMSTLRVTSSPVAPVLRLWTWQPLLARPA